MPVPVDLPPEPPAWVAPCLRPPGRDAGRPKATGSVTSDRHPLRVHFAPGYEGRAVAVLAALEVAWDVQVDRLGFQPPVLPDDADGPELDLYLTVAGEGNAWVEPAVSLVDAVPGDGRMSTAAFIVIDRDLPEDRLASYAVHEFNHVLQYATDFTETSLTLWEATAVAAQGWTLGDAGVWDADVRYFQEAPWAPVLTGDSYWLFRNERVGWLYEYGAGMWVMTLDRQFGAGDGTMGAALWDAASNEGRGREPDVADALEALTADDVGVFLSHVARDRWLTGDRWDPRGLAEAASWDAAAAVPVDAALAAADLPARVTFPHGPMILGQGFVTVDLTGIEAVEARVVSKDGLRSALLALWDDGEVIAVDEPVVVRPTGDTLVLAVTHLGPPGWDADDDPYVPGDLVLEVYRPGEPPRGCGCAAAPVAIAWPWLAGVALVARRRAYRVATLR